MRRAFWAEGRGPGAEALVRGGGNVAGVTE